MRQTSRFALFAAVALLLLASQGRLQVSARSDGAPTAACADLTQRHFGAPQDCGSNCPFSVSLIAIDGTPVAAGAAQTYRCGSEHTLRIATSDSAQPFRGFAIQARQSTETFTNDASFLGQFVNAPDGGDWRIWDCATASATHTNGNDKTSIDVTWRAPPSFGPNATMWFSITRTFINFHSQIRGLQLSADAGCPGNLRFSCEFQEEGNEIVAKCEAEGFIPASFECQIDDQPRFACERPFRFPLANITGVGEHTLRVIANTETATPLITSATVSISPQLDCAVSQSGSTFSVQCTPNDQPDSVLCTINGEIFTPCELDKIEVDTGDFDAESVNMLTISFTVDGQTAQRSVTFTGTRREDPFQVSCSSELSSDQSSIIVECTGNREIASQVCTLNGKDIAECKLPLSIASSEFNPGVNFLEIVFSDAAGDTDTYRTNITVGTGFSLQCETSSGSGTIQVSCVAEGGQVTNVTCIYDDGAIVESCDLDTSIDLARFDAGAHTLNIIASTADGRSAQATLGFQVAAAPFSANCDTAVNDDSTAVVVECTANRDIASQTCTLNGIEIANCSLPLEIPVAGLMAGANSLQIVLMDGEGASVTVTSTINIGLPELSLACGASSGAGTIQVSCVAQGGQVTNATCIYDGGAIVESCDLDTSIDLARFEAGAHTLNIIAITADGRIAQATIRFQVPAAPFAANCDTAVNDDSTAVVVECTANRDIASQTCTLNGIEIANCSLPLEIPIARLMAGANSLQVVLMDGEGASVTVTSTINIGQPPVTELSLQCGTSSGGGKIQVSCVAQGGEVSNVTCIYDDGDIVESCALDTSIDLSRFEAGPHTLRIIAETADGLMGQIIVRFNVSETVTPLKIFCNVYSLPGQIDIGCEASRELNGTAICRINLPGFPTEAVPCDIEAFSLTDEFLPLGSYVLNIEAIDVLGQSAVLNVPFTLTAGVAPGFRIISGPVLLGQRPELLDFAARSGSIISVMAADTPQTVIVQRNVAVTINCSDWFRNNPGDSTSITHTPLNTLGDEIGEAFTLQPTDFGRILVDDESVTITRTLLVGGAEDPDFSLYMCVSCMTTDNGLLENCGSASVTVYPIGSAPEIDAAPDDEPPTVGDAVTTTRIGADFCLNFPTRPPTLHIVCNDVDELGVLPVPSLSWYKDDVLAITQDSFGQPSFSEEFLSQGRNGLLRTGALMPPALIAIPGTSQSGYGELFLNFILSISDASMLPSGVNASNLDREVFSVLLGRWECRVNNTFGEDSVVTELSDCAIVMFVLDCSTAMAGVSGPLRVNCFGSRDIASVECIYDDGLIVEPCDFPVTVDFTRFAPGSHRLLLNVTSTGGEIATHEVGFNVPAPLVITCSVSDSPGVTSVACVVSKELFLTPSCSLQRVGATESQSIICSDLTGIELTSSLYPPGDYVLTISAIDVEEQTTTVQVNLTIQSTGESPIQCRTTLDCSGEFTLMSAEDCCVGNPDGLSFTVPGVEMCQVCIVFGWFNDSITGVEQGPGISIPVGYQKGAAQAAQNLVFDVVDQPGTANPVSSMDYTIGTSRVRILAGSTTPDNVIVTFRVDTIAQEPDETLSLQLVPLIPGPTGDAIFFRDSITLTIIDSDTVQILLTEDDYRTSESGLLPVVVSKSSRIASPITLTVSPVTIDEAVASGIPLPPLIPEDNPLSPSRANLDDFNNTVLTITFAADEDAEMSDLAAFISIIDDAINEAVEQFFVVQLSLGSSLNPAGVDISVRPTSLGRIIDNDPIRIGFEESTYSFSEPSSVLEEYNIYLAKEEEVVSEQTFLINVIVSASVPPDSTLQPAILGDDYLIDFSNASSVVITFPPSAQRVPFTVIILPDNVPEGDEAFIASSEPSDGSPAYLLPSELSPESVIVITDGGPPIMPELDCIPLLGTNLLTISCFSSSGPIDTATCSIDGGPAYQCDPQFLEIDPFLLTPGPHILSVSFNLTNGAEGIFAYNFTAEERPGATIELIGPSLEDGELFIIEEGETLTLLIAASGFSYGNIPLNVSLITYSDYAALGFTLEDEFSSALVPEDAASSDDLNLFSARYLVSAGAPLPPLRIQISTILDSMPEDAEGAVLLLRFQESELDERDMEQVQLVRNSYLIRINESVGVQEPEVDCLVSETGGLTMVMCMSTTPLVSPQICTLESGGLPITPITFDCNITFVAISVQDYPPGEYNLTIMATDIFGQSVDEDVSLLLPEPLIFGECRIISNRLVTCNTSLDSTQVPLIYSCSYDDGPREACPSNFEIDFTRFELNTVHTLMITITTLLGQELPVQPPIIFFVQRPMLQCFEQADARLLFLNCFLQGGVLDVATCSFDNGAASRCDPTGLQIDQYSFSPGPHSLTIAYNATTGEQGRFQYNFTGILRQPAVFGIISAEGALDLSEDIVLSFSIDATGFSYGAVPIKISALTYSEYAARGFNIENDFSPSIIPANAADAYDYRPLNITADFYAGGFVGPTFYFFGAYSDGIPEEREGLVLLLEIVESELDPRDVGNVSLSRSAYLFRINDTELSNFAIQIGDIVLGPIPELLDIAARNGEAVAAFITDDRQTAIVADGAIIRLDWLRWVTETLGSSASNANYTLRRTQLDEFGNPVGLPEVVGPSEPGDRIEVKLDPETNEYYVQILGIIARAGAEDPDRAIYELEACYLQPDASQRCASSNMTVYALNIPQGVQLSCFPSSDNISQIVLVCFAENLDNISSANCSYDGGPPTPCDLGLSNPLFIDLFQFTPGPHTLTISFVLADGTRGQDFQFDFNSSETRPRVSIALVTDDGVTRATEGELILIPVLSSGFSYGQLYIRITALTYSEFAARGFNIEDEFSPGDIPAISADALDYNNTTPLIPFLSGVLPPIPQYVQLFIYEDGLEEETEGLILFVDIPESLLDPRDVGQIDLLRSAFLVTINESETSNYQILIGDVELGPRPELLDVAVPLFTLTRALVTDEQQTVILMNTSLIILDWSRWVTDTLGDSAGDASYTIRRIQLDVLGNPIRSPEEVQPTDLSSRIIVQLNPANNEYYVLISEAFVSAIGAEDPDRAIYELEGCVPESDGSEQCYKSNITVYALGPVFGPLDVECTVGAVSGLVRVTCESSNPLISPQSCTLESSLLEQNFDCNAASLMLSVEDYPPGDYNLTIEVIDVFGQIQVRSYSFFLPEPLLFGQCFLDPRQLSVFCNTSLDNTLVPFTYTCSYNSGPAEPCSSDFFIDPFRLGVGEHTLDITIETEFDQVLNVPPLVFVYEGPLTPTLECFEIADTRVITIDCIPIVGGFVDFATCSFDGGIASPCEVSFLEIDQYSFSPGPHTLTIAFNLTTGGEGEFQYNFTGRVRPPAVFELPSDGGVIDIMEGEEYEEELLSSGFSYDRVPIRVYSLTYSEYAAAGFNLEDSFDANVIPANAANAYDFEEVDTTLPGLAEGFFDPPELYLEAYQDGIAEQSEGFVLLLEIDESELDPRDVGNVSLSRSVYLIRINQSDTSNFQVLIGDVDLGQDRQEELLEVAAVEDERVRVFVTDERQTAIVTNGAYILLDWFRWVTETLDDSAINATYTIRSTELDENGDPEEEAEEVESSDRIEVEFESDEDEYYVKISRVIAREMDDEDPDRAIYELEACVPQPDGSEQCYESNITVFAIQVVELECSQSRDSRLLNITCFSPGNELDSNANCSFDGGPAFSCSLAFFEIDQFSFSPGPHTLTISFSVSTGEQGEFVYEFTGLVREPAVFGFSSDMGSIDITEGIEYEDSLQYSGFSYGAVPISITTLTYSEYADRGFILENSFDSIAIPSNAASVFDYEEVDTTLSGLAGAVFSSPSLTLNAYQDGEAEQLEGFILYLEIDESELDPRDVGNVSLSRSAYLVRINQSDTSNFQVLIGDVELGQDIPGLLDVAAGEEDRVRVFVSDDIQTAVVTDGAYILLDWFRWVTETLGDSVVNATFTITSTELDENGEVDEEPEEVESNDRIKIEFESDEDEYYVKISRVVARETSEYDPDRNIYELEACVDQPDGSERCYSSNITVFAIDTLPPVEALEIECNVAAVSGIVRVMCESNNPLESPGTCTLDSSEEESFNFSCNAAGTFVISIDDYPPGEYNLTIEAEDIFDQVANETFTIFLSEPLLIGACVYDVSDLSVFCNTTLDQTQVELEYLCSYDSGPFESCGPNFIADDVRLAVGMHSLEITISTELGQVLSVPLGIIIPEVELLCLPIMDFNLITFSCSSPSREIDTATCSFDGGPATPCDLELYTIDQFSFSPGPHVLTVVYNVTSGRVGEYRQNFTGEIRPPAIINELISADGIIDIIEGQPFTNILTTSGFSYGNIPIRISTLTYSEYAASGYVLEDDFDPSEIPMDAADVYDYRTIDRTIFLIAGSPENSNYELTLDAYLDGLAEELEGFVLYLDVIESELDPRDVGQVNLSRSVYLVVINQSDTSNFQVLIGDVELGQDIPGLLDVAAGEEDRVRVFVTDEMQTAVATEEAYILLDWLRWVTERFGDSAENATFTLYRTQLNESGAPLGPEQVVNASTDRIEIEFEFDENEYYVKIEEVVARESEGEVPDRAIYELEACVHASGGDPQCFRSGITVYAIDTAPQLGAVFELPSDGGVIDIMEGGEYEEELLSSGFSYGPVTIRVYSLTYSEYEAAGFNLEDSFDANVIPANAANAYDYEEVDTTLSGQAGGMFIPPELSLEAYQDGIAEQSEGFVLLLEIDESELDPRDVGSVSLSRSVYLVRINQSDTSNFQVLIGDVDLGQDRPELLEVAAVEDERVRVFVTDERQTAIVTNGAYILLDWFRWVTETLGDSAINATFTIRSTELDEDGEPEEEAEEVESSDRIEVEFESDEDEYYVKISRVIAREMDDEDPDRAIYELEACVPASGGDPQCFRSGITVYAIDTAPQLGAVFELPSDGGVIDIMEGGEYEGELLSSGFSYGPVPIRVYSLTYSEYEAAGFNLEDSFDANVIPANAANAYDYEEVDTTLSGQAGGMFIPPELSLEAYQDGIAEQSEGFVLLLEIDESELDPRDVGSVSLSRSVYLVRINQSDTSNFQVLIGDVDLGQDRPELLEVAAVEDERVRVFVTDERQTAIVTNGAYILLDWFRWVTETLGDSAINATFTIRSTELDEDGEPEEEAEEVESSDRIEVEFESDEDEYYVKISRVIAREMDDEDPDRAIYELEACVPASGGDPQCFRSGITVYAIDTTPQLGAVFELPSDGGVIDIMEGGEYEGELLSSGFSYGPVPIRVYSLTYSEYEAAGFNLEDSFDANVIPANAANAYDYEEVDTTLSGQAGGMFIPPELSLEAYQDGIAEQSEGFVLLLEIDESELDPRDVGNVGLSRSVYLVRINQSDTSNFQVLIGDVDLGQDRQELLEVAAVEDERVRVFVTDERQTAIVTNGAYILLDWFRWVTETLGDSAINATFTIRSTELDEDGEPEEEAEEVESSDRIEVEFESDEDEYYVKISRVIAREMDDEDPDRATYELEACVPQPDGSEQCYKSNITVFAIQVVELQCFQPPGSRLLTITCFSPGNELDSNANCSFDGGPAFSCSLAFFEIDQFSFSPGPHTLTISFSVSTGEQGEFVYEFTGLVREPAVFRFSSDRGSIDITEGREYEDSLQYSGFSYGAVPISITTLTYSEYMDRGLSLENSFDSSAIPSIAASEFDYEEVDTTLSGLAGGVFFPPSLTLNAYQDGEAEQLEGFILYLEIDETELDPRDVGNVSLSRSAYLVRINQSDTSNFQVLIGDVELGQDIPGLLDVAAGEEDRVRVFVSDDTQTAIVTDGAYILLDWFRSVTETLGDSVVNATFTITSTELDENGEVDEEPEEVESNDRIEVEFESDEDEYYVKISRVVARETPEYDPDRNIYELEACVDQPDGSERCYSSNITVFAIDTLPPVEALEIECNVAGVSGIVRVMCESNNPLESPGTCTLDSSEEESFTFSCNAAESFVISIDDYPPGEYNLTIEAEDIFDQGVNETFTIFLSEPLLIGACFYDLADLSVFCNTTLDQTQVELEYLCSYDSGPFESCGPNFIADDVRLAVGMHSLEITISTELGQVLSVPLGIIIPEVELLCFPILDSNLIMISCSSPSREIDTATCSFDGGPATPCDLEMYTIDQFSFSPGPHVLTVVYNVTSGRMGEYRQNFTGEIRPSAIINELISADGIIDINEGQPLTNILTTSGFSYGSIPIRISTLTYSEYAASGYVLEDDFDPSEIPIDAADVYDYRTIDRTISLTAGSPENSNYELTLDAYLDGLAEELEGFVLYLDVMESELDPRDVGQVNLSRSVYLVVINQSDTSNFQVLIGDVELGQDIPGLLDVAARDGDRVRVFVTDEMQTAIATEEAYILLDWLRWVTERFGDSAENATFTLYRTQLDESGAPLGPEQVVNASTDRIEIEFEFDENEYYVKIEEVVARESEGEVPDRAIYELEACVPASGGNPQCLRSGITVYAIDTTPQLELVCSASGFDGMVTVSCESNNPLVSPQLCTPLPLEVLIFCNASSFTLSVEDFPPGDYNFTVEARDIFGQTATSVVDLILSEPLLTGSCTTSQLYVFCNTTLDQTQVPLEYTCSYDSGPEEPCGPNFIIDRTRFSPGTYTLDVTITTLFGQILRVPPIEFVIEVMPVVELQCEEVPSARVLTLNCSSLAGPVIIATCSFNDGPPSSCDLDALVIDQFMFSPGFHTLNIDFLVVGGQGSFQYNFTGQVRPSVEIELDSEEGLIDVFEGVPSLNSFFTEGFSYGPFEITVSILTFSEYEERGYNLADSFESDEIPDNAANDYDYSSSLGREAEIDFEPVGVGLVPVPPPLDIFAYIDGLPEETEGLVVYLKLEESELDPRDVGQIALERSTYLIRINSSPSSTFEIIIGDVELGQRPELLEKAAQPESEVRAFVTEDQQTAVAAHNSRIRLDWSQWVEDEFGSAAGSANYTIYSTLLNETGGIDGPRRELLPTPPDLASRIVVRIDPETNEFYVDIVRVNVIVAAEDADHAIYELEACYFEDDGSRDCERASITLYAIGQTPIVISADEDDEPEETPIGLRSPVGADFCLSFDADLKTLELRCDTTSEGGFTYPPPDRLWYKDGVLVYRAGQNVRLFPEIRDEFYQTGNNTLLQPGIITPPPLVALNDGSLFLDWTAINLTALPDQLPEGVTQETFRMDVFRTLLGTWECELENSLGESEAETTLTDCATDDVDLECESSIGNVFATILECEAEFDLVDIQCTIDGAALENCSFPLAINRLDFSEDEHILRINVRDSRGETDSFELQFSGVLAGNLPALLVDFEVLGDPQSPGAGSSRVVFLPEAPTTSSVISIEVSGGDTVAPIPFHIMPLTYDEFEARYSAMTLNNLFPMRPLDPAGDSDFNTNSFTIIGASEFSPNIVLSDSIPELSEGFIIYLEVDRANTDPRDLSRLQFLNRHILAIIEDDDALVNCNANVLDDEVLVNCPGIDGLPPGNNYQCSVDFAPPESCLFPFEIARREVVPGRHNIRLFQRRAGEPIPDQILGGAQFQIDPLRIRFVNNTPILDVDRVYAEIEISRPGVPMECHLTRFPGPRMDCSNGRVEITGVVPGDFTLRVVAVDPFISDRFNPDRRAIARNRLWVKGNAEFCTTLVRNDGVTVNQNTMTIDFYNTGEPTGYLCSFDRGEFFECTSPYTRENIPIGRHRIKVVPLGCNRNFKGFTTQFDVI